MSLDVYLELNGHKSELPEPKIFIRENGQTKEISREEWDKLHPNIEPATFMSGESDNVYSGNITHNLGSMAKAARIYMYLWRPEDIGITKASELIKPLAAGLNDLLSDTNKYMRYNPVNGWGSYEVLVEFVREYLAACQRWPDANVRVSR